MFTLSSLKHSGSITIQCHDDPDADAIASAFAVYSYLASIDKPARIIYAGRFPVTRPALLEMVHKLAIPIEFVKDAPDTETLVVVDGQYGADNVTLLSALTVIVIDHHKEEKTLFDDGVVNPLLGSCSTLIWDLLRKERFPFDRYPNVSTALYYGMFADTRGLSEIYHPLDKDMRDFLEYDSHLIKSLQHTTLPSKDLSVAGITPQEHYRTDSDLRYSVFKAEPCDPAVLGSISNLALQADSIDACVVYSCMSDGARVSVSSRAREIMASDFIEFLTEGVGFGGGSPDKGSGFIKEAAVKALAMTADEFIGARAREYFSSYDMIDAASHNLDILSMPQYRKKKIPVGYVLSTDIFAPGAPIMIRTLEGDAEAVVSDDIYIMVGILGEVYPIKAEKFRQSYEKIESGLSTDYSYPPTVRNRATGEVKELAGLIKPCAALGVVTIYAEPVNRNTKVFTSWNTKGYMLGKTGDYIAIRENDVNDVYIVRRDIFDITYEPV